MKEIMETTFHNLTITIDAKTPQDAYDKLCQLLADHGMEFTTSTFSTYDHGEEGEERDTEELFPIQASTACKTKRKRP